ncbi:U4/U6-U5 snRNP complex subunit lsm6, variant 3 [Taiwanofungus camphoratus]|nr:U4/U6-U5 snRNP complex subunit lsm6, variant 2 [Antrodia cinnamomea]KAI0933007.1 U4/U6-U5 snRNP complex subunit lsm6, variant 2 [Antrodia cinnamomea]KAI0935532.1 hypothetical protein AcV5_003943 [Antrodia cinnamomea]KAI0962763.1 U4/U6-U5 snRNP complex subunit lsm6, variant 3 [Antrodia cinnamomea]
MDESTPPPPPAPPSDPSPPPPPPTTTGSPTDFLKGVVGKRVVVRLTSGVDYRGECLAYLERRRGRARLRSPPTQAAAGDD